jgi:hypothetical protein
MSNGLSDFATKHWIVGGAVASLLWLWGGKQYAEKSKWGVAVSCQCIAVVIIVMVAGWTVAERQWAGVALAIFIFAMEMRELTRTFRVSQVHKNQ